MQIINAIRTRLGHSTAAIAARKFDLASEILSVKNAKATTKAMKLLTDLKKIKDQNGLLAGNRLDNGQKELTKLQAKLDKYNVNAAYTESQMIRRLQDLSPQGVVEIMDNKEVDGLQTSLINHAKQLIGDNTNHLTSSAADYLRERYSQRGSSEGSAHEDTSFDPGSAKGQLLQKMIQENNHRLTDIVKGLHHGDNASVTSIWQRMRSLQTVEHYIVVAQEEYTRTFTSSTELQNSFEQLKAETESAHLQMYIYMMQHGHMGIVKNIFDMRRGDGSPTGLRQRIRLLTKIEQQATSMSSKPNLTQEQMDYFTRVNQNVQLVLQKLNGQNP